MISSDFVGLLATLIAIESASPLPPHAVDGVTQFLSRFEVKRVGHLALWARPPRNSRVWLYSHIDTKPAGAKSKWLSDPLVLRKDGERLFGLGISDAKFQLLNMLVVAGDWPFGIVIDGGEEIGSSVAADWLTTQPLDTLVIVDGASRAGERYDGTMGQLDGIIHYDSGFLPTHPARAHRTGAVDWICKFADDVKRLGLYVTVTAIQSEARERSLTLEKVSLKFDLRFTPGDSEAVGQFVSAYKPELRQHYAPLIGRLSNASSKLAPFSSPLGSTLTDLEQVIVMPGALPENGNHQPNEWIYCNQIEAHRTRLRTLGTSLWGR
jgi:acetylornithine deacetylase/succinyl-diaminopimelate desuccinylase-like protein